MAKEIELVGSDGNPVSLQVYQDVYNSMTGKTEVLQRLFFEAHQVEMNDIERLHRDFEVQLEQYDCKVTNCHVSVRYCNGKSEGFSGFNRFKLDGVNKSSATENVEIEYDFLVLLPKTKEAKPYKLVVAIRSTLGVVQRLDETGATETERSFFFQLERGTARLEIHYVDLAVARSLEALVEDWYKSLSKRGGTTQRKIKDFLTAVVPTFSRLTIVAASAFLAHFLLVGRTETNPSLFSAGIIAGASIAMAGIIAIPTSNYLRKQVERAIPYSVITLGRADSLLVESSKNNLFKLGASALSKLVGAIGLGLLTTYVATKIGM